MSKHKCEFTAHKWFKFGNDWTFGTSGGRWALKYYYPNYLQEMTRRVTFMSSSEARIFDILILKGRDVIAITTFLNTFMSKFTSLFQSCPDIQKELVEEIIAYANTHWEWK